jgi:signal transduction histidine kinase
MIEDDVKHSEEMLRKLPVISTILDFLKRNLPGHLVYHAFTHTEDVLSEVIRFAITDELPAREIELLAIAAAFHDAGFVKSPVANEPIAARMAREALEKHSASHPTSGYTPDEISLIEQMILDTSLRETQTGLRQVPTCDLSRYLLDADLSNLGRDDFFDKGELQRQELGYDQEVFRRKSFELLNSHRWLTNAARLLRQPKKDENLLLLKKMITPESESSGLSFDRLGFLAKLPLLLNSSLDTKRILKIALEELKDRLEGTAATIFLLDEIGEQLTFWALQGTEEGELEGTKMPSGRGIVGWVIEKQEAARVDDAQNDSRFFAQIDKEVGFETRNLLCAPLTVRGDRKLGAVQVLNKVSGHFCQEDVLFLEQFCSQMALAIDNARLFEAVQERNRQLQVLDNRKSEMMSVIAHEFRTPLNLIGTSAELLGSGTLNDTKAVDQMCSILNRGVRRLTKLIGEIKNLSLSTSESMEITLSRISVQHMIREIVEHFEAAAVERNLTLVVECPEQVGECEGDTVLLLLALKNLVGNAIRFTPDGGRIVIRGTRAAGLIRVEVSDTGIGLDQGEIPLIFEKFYEVNNALNHSSGDLEFKSGGLGLGLATVKAILKAHASTCEVSSEAGKGSTFAFSLPAI